MIKLKTNWTAKNDTAKMTVERLKECLDYRLKSIKEADQASLERVLTSFLAYGANAYSVQQQLVPVQDRALLQACLDCLVGEVLQREGRNEYKLKPKYLSSYQCSTLNDDAGQPSILTNYESLIADNSYQDIPLDQIVALNFQKTGYLKVDCPYLQTKWYLENSAPQRSWLNLQEEEYELKVLEWDEILDRALADNRKTLARYSYDTILCHDPQKASQDIYIASSRISGRQGFRYSSKGKDIWGRHLASWGVRPC